MDEAIAAEVRRKSFKEIGPSSSILDNTGGISVSAAYQGNKKFNNNYKTKVSNDAKQAKTESDAQAPKGAQPQPDKEHTRADADKLSGSKSGKPFRKGNCRICNEKGHWAIERNSAKKGQKKSQLAMWK